MFCALHRYSDMHKCNFDYKQMGADEIRKNNPAVRGEKVQKLWVRRVRPYAPTSHRRRNTYTHTRTPNAQDNFFCFFSRKISGWNYGFESLYRTFGIPTSKSNRECVCVRVCFVPLFRPEHTHKTHHTDSFLLRILGRRSHIIITFLGASRKFGARFPTMTRKNVSPHFLLPHISVFFSSLPSFSPLILNCSSFSSFSLLDNTYVRKTGRFMIRLKILHFFPLPRRRAV